MSIIAVTGDPGTGKGVYCVQEIIVPLMSTKRHRNVYTNIEGIDHDMISINFDIPLHQVKDRLHVMDFHDEEKIQRFWEHIDTNAVMVLDEAQNYFGSSVFNKELSLALRKYVTMHRHLGHDIYIATQDLNNLDVNFRRILTYTHHLKIRRIVSSGKSISVAIFDKDYLTSEPLNKTTFTHSEKTYPCYDSYSNEEVIEDKVKVNVFNNMKLKVLLVAILILGVNSCINTRKYGLFGLKRLSGHEVEESKSNKKNNFKRDSRGLVSKSYESRIVFGDSVFYILEDGTELILPVDGRK